MRHNDGHKDILLKKKYSIPKEMTKIEHLPYVNDRNKVFNFRKHLELQESCVIMEGNEIIGILCHDIIPPRSTILID